MYCCQMIQSHYVTLILEHNNVTTTTFGSSIIHPSQFLYQFHLKKKKNESKKV
jgi:hypothetical protein